MDVIEDLATRGQPLPRSALANLRTVVRWDGLSPLGQRYFTEGIFAPPAKRASKALGVLAAVAKWPGPFHEMAARVYMRYLKWVLTAPATIPTALRYIYHPIKALRRRTLELLSDQPAAALLVPNVELAEEAWIDAVRSFSLTERVRLMHRASVFSIASRDEETGRTACNAIVTMAQRVLEELDRAFPARVGQHLETERARLATRHFLDLAYRLERLLPGSHRHAECDRLRRGLRHHIRKVATTPAAIRPLFALPNRIDAIALASGRAAYFYHWLEPGRALLATTPIPLRHGTEYWILEILPSESMLPAALAMVHQGRIDRAIVMSHLVATDFPVPPPHQGSMIAIVYPRPRVPSPVSFSPDRVAHRLRWLFTRHGLAYGHFHRDYAWMPRGSLAIAGFTAWRKDGPANFHLVETALGLPVGSMGTMPSSSFTLAMGHVTDVSSETAEHLHLMVRDQHTVVEVVDALYFDALPQLGAVCLPYVSDWPSPSSDLATSLAAGQWPSQATRRLREWRARRQLLEDALVELRTANPGHDPLVTKYQLLLGETHRLRVPYDSDHLIIAQYSLDGWRPVDPLSNAFGWARTMAEMPMVLATRPFLVQNEAGDVKMVGVGGLLPKDVFQELTQRRLRHIDTFYLDLPRLTFYVPSVAGRLTSLAMVDDKVTWARSNDAGHVGYHRRLRANSLMRLARQEVEALIQLRQETTTILTDGMALPAGVLDAVPLPDLLEMSDRLLLMGGQAVVTDDATWLARALRGRIHYHGWDEWAALDEPVARLERLLEDQWLVGDAGMTDAIRATLREFLRDPGPITMRTLGRVVKNQVLQSPNVWALLTVAFGTIDPNNRREKLGEIVAFHPTALRPDRLVPPAAPRDGTMESELTHLSMELARLLLGNVEAGARYIRDLATSLGIVDDWGGVIRQAIQRMGSTVVFSGRPSPLTTVEQSQLRRALVGPPEQVLIDQGNATATRADLARLGPGEMLNDEIINLYMELIEQTMGLVEILAMSTHFYSTLVQQGVYDIGRVRRWPAIRSGDLLRSHRVFIPIHWPNRKRDLEHWTLAIIDTERRALVHCDSLGNDDHGVLANLSRLVKDVGDMGKWTMERPDVPQQDNGVDCGVFVCWFGRCVARDLPLVGAFSASDIPLVRQRILLDLVDWVLH